MTLRTPLVLLLALAACGDDGGGSTADAATTMCTPEGNAFFTGEYIDWDSGGDPGFLGIYNATVTPRSDASLSDITAPNGRWEKCVPFADDIADVTPMGEYVPGVIVMDKDVLATAPTLSYRSFTTTRAADAGYDAAKAQVFVQVIGGSRTVTTAATPAIMQVNDGTTWTAGNTGSTIYLGNIDVAASTTLTVSGGDTIGTKTVPLSAGSFTYVTLVAK